MKRPILTGLLLVVSGVPVLAGPLDRAVVAKNAEWVVHVDIEAITQSKVGRFMLAHRAEMNLGELDKVKAELGLDPVTDLKGITVYGSGPDENAAVAIIHGTGAIDQCIDAIRAREKGVEETTLGGFKAYTWTEGETTKFAQVRPKGDDRIVIAASDKELLLSGIAVLEGKSANITKAEGDLAVRKPHVGSFVFAAATKLPHAEALPIKNAEGFVLDAGENDEEFFADVALTTKTSEEAARLTQAATGVLAFAKIGLANDAEYKEVLELIDGVSISCDGSRIVGKFRYSCDKIMQALKDIKEQKAAPKAAKSKSVKVKSEKHDGGDGDR